MSTTFPHPCTHCGLCCMAITCPIGQNLMQVPAQGPCPALEWEGDESRCGLISHPDLHIPAATLARLDLSSLPAALGSGAGCCMSARVFFGGVQQDFASLPAADKTTLVRSIRGK